MKTGRSFRLFPRCFPPFSAFFPGAVCLPWLYFHKTDGHPFQGSRGTDGTLPVPGRQIQRRTRPDIPVVFEADAAHRVDRAVCVGSGALNRVRRKGGTACCPLLHTNWTTSKTAEYAAISFFS